jgi:ubiquinone/menaquinone biosynthesis C-methylase UbiE
MKAASVIKAILIPLAGIMFFFGAMARIDSHEELIEYRVWDVVVGLMFAVSFVLAREVKPGRRRTTVVVAFVIWLLVSGVLVSWHEFQVYARTTGAEHAMTDYRIRETYKALTAYSTDCGSFPSDEKGLDALRENPGLTQWNGPYIPYDEPLTDAWGHRLQYALRDNKPVVWSCGKDGISGTEDDITMDYEETRTPRSQRPAPYPAEMNKKFTDPDVDIQEFVKQFENETRDIYAKRREITRAVGLRPGDAVADIGAGTGLFTQLFAEQVGPTGTVYAVDIAPAFVKYLAEQAKKHGRERVAKTVLNTPDSAELPPGSIDVAFLYDTYHHFEHPEKMLASIHRALRPGRRMVVIDFDLRKDSSEFVKQRARAAKEVYFREIAAAGFELVETKEAPVITDNFYAEFRRVQRKSQAQP